MDTTPEATVPGPAQAEAALAAVRQHQRAAIIATYNTPWWYFTGLGLAMLLFSGVYLLDDWVEIHFGFFASMLVFFAGIIVFAICLGVLVALVAKRHPAQPAQKFNVFDSRRAVVLTVAAGVGGLVVVYGLAYLALGNLEHATAAMLAVTAVAIAVGGRPLQRLFRHRVLRRNGLQEDAT